jgi:enoyl-CoA hydratase
MIEREERDEVVTLRLAHGKASALDLELIEALQAELAEIASSAARAVVLTGTGSIFSAGVDLFRVAGEDGEYVRRFLPALVRAIRTLFALPKPVVAATNGHAIAGGCILVAACDYRLMARGVGRIGVPELLVGVPFPAAVLEVLRFALPPQHLQEIVYTGRTWVADEALAKGLVDEVTDAEALVERALEVARQLAAIPTEAFGPTKRELRRAALERAGSIEGGVDADVLAAWAAPETRERIRAYLARTVGKKT